MSDRFKSDDAKAEATFQQRGVTFEMAKSVFDDPEQIETPDSGRITANPVSNLSDRRATDRFLPSSTLSAMDAHG